MRRLTTSLGLVGLTSLESGDQLTPPPTNIISEQQQGTASNKTQN